MNYMELKTTPSTEEVVISLVGELDQHSARQAMDAGERIALLYPIERVILDLSGLSFMDSSGLAVALSLHRQLVRSGRRLIIRRCPKQPMRVFHAAGIDKMIAFEEGVPC